MYTSNKKNIRDKKPKDFEEIHKSEKKKIENYRQKKTREEKEYENLAKKKELEKVQAFLSKLKEKCHYCAKSISLNEGGVFPCYCCIETRMLESNPHFHVDLVENSSRCIHCGRSFQALSQDERKKFHQYLESIGVKEEKQKFHLELCVVEKRLDLQNKFKKLNKFYGEDLMFKWLKEDYNSVDIQDIIDKELIPFSSVKPINTLNVNSQFYCRWRDGIPLMIKKRLNDYDNSLGLMFAEKCSLCQNKTPHQDQKYDEECSNCYSTHWKCSGDCGPTGYAILYYLCLHCGNKWSVEI